MIEKISILLSFLLYFLVGISFPHFEQIFTYREIFYAHLVLSLLYSLPFLQALILLLQNGIV
jgi:hypothetical protein